MYCRPKVGSRVKVHYAKHYCAMMPLHGRIGIVRVVARGPGPRNHGVEIDGRLYAVNCGHLNKLTAGFDDCEMDRQTALNKGER